MSRFKLLPKAPFLDYRDCWAKTNADGNPGISVPDHCRIAGYVARELLKFLPSAMRRRLGENPALVVALHDVGKVSPGFQLKYFRQALAASGHPLARHYQEFESNHAAVSEMTLAAVYGHAIIAQVAGAHHGVRQDNRQQKTDLEYHAEDSEWPRQRRRLIQTLEKEFGALGEPPREPLDGILLAGLTCVADWIASDERLFAASALPSDADLTGLAARAVERCGWRRPSVKTNLTFAAIFGVQPYPVQQPMIEHVDQAGVYILEAPTGMGKTEAALYAAYALMERRRGEGIYFGLPTRLTSDRIHRRVNAFLEHVSNGATARLAHGTAWLARFETETDIRQTSGAEADLSAWFNPLKRALLLPYAVGTIDQALLGVLNVRHFFLRLFGLAGKIVVLDEVHSYDMFTGTHLVELVRLLRALDCTVIILSATLTAERRNALLGISSIPAATGYPLLSVAQGETVTAHAFAPPPNRRVAVQLRDWPAAEVAAEAVGQALRGVCVLCIANTVAQAQEWHRAVKSEMPEEAFEVGLLHSKFIGRHRTAKEDFWMERLGKNGARPQGCILIATQIVEQSVDIDADLLITELAPTDMLVQRLGRLWRHDRAKRPAPEPRVVIVSRNLPETADAEALCDTLGAANALVYSPYVLCRSHEVWKRFDNLSVDLPAAVRSLLEETYRERQTEPPAWRQLRAAQNRKSDKLARCAIAMQAGRAGMPVRRDDERAATRYNDRPMRTVLLVQGITDGRTSVAVDLLDGTTVTIPKFGWNLPAAAELHRNTLSLAAYQLPAAVIPAWLAKALDSDALLACVDEDGRLVFDTVPANLAYDEWRGLTKLTANAKTSRRLDDTHAAYTDYETEDFPYESCDW